MSSVVGQKGQIVIEKQIRDRLGIEPGWRTIQTLVDDHIEVRLLPPLHDRSLRGCLRQALRQQASPKSTPKLAAKKSAANETEWENAVARAVGKEFKRRQARP